MIHYYKEKSISRMVNPMEYHENNREEAWEKGQSKLQNGNMLYCTGIDWWIVEYGQVENHVPSQELKEYFEEMILQFPDETIFEYRMNSVRYRCTIEYKPEAILSNFNDAHEIAVWEGHSSLADYYQARAERDAIRDAYESIEDLTLMEILMQPEPALFADQISNLESTQYYEEN